MRKLSVCLASGVVTGCPLNIVFSLRILESLPPLPRQSSAAIGFTKNYVTSHCVESFEGWVGRGEVAVNCEKTQLFLNTLFHHSVLNDKEKVNLPN